MKVNRGWDIVGALLLYGIAFLAYAVVLARVALPSATTTNRFPRWVGDDLHQYCPARHPRREIAPNLHSAKSQPTGEYVGCAPYVAPNLLCEMP